MSNQQPEHGPRVTAYLEEHPLIRELVAGYEGMAIQTVDYDMRGRKFSPRLARLAVQDIFDTHPDNLGLNGVENWADFYYYIHKRLMFRMNYLSYDLEQMLDGYKAARLEDRLEAERKKRYSRRRKS